jgi:membrane fusion protein (multidrug efflux system)
MTQTTSNSEQKPKSNKFKFILGGMLIFGSVLGIVKYIHGKHHIETDDAQIESNISPIIARVGGYVAAIKVKDNQFVKKGDTLIVIDNSDYLLKVQQAEAALEAAKSGFEASKSTYQSTTANTASAEASVLNVNAQIEAAKVRVWRANQDFDRYKNLIQDNTITQQQFEQASAEKQSAEKYLQVLHEQKNIALKQVTAIKSSSEASHQQSLVSNAVVKQREADLAAALLNLSYTVITAPTDGQVSKINAQIGQLLQPGQALFSVIADHSVWVVANFKETQVERMKEGLDVEVNADAFPGKHFKAILNSIAPTTGAKFSLLPPDNASGNFVKIVQRIPVKITFVDEDTSQLKLLRAGMNVTVDVHID